MPELPEVETVRRSLLPHLVGRRIEAVTVWEHRLRRPVDVAALDRLRGRTVTDLTRRAKYLVIHLGDADRLVVHLGMSGRLYLVERDVPREPHVHVGFDLDDGSQLRFRDHRRFGLVEVIDVHGLAVDRRFAALGVEPLSRACTAALLRQEARGLRLPVKSFLMDARRVVGIGNIYANEALFLARIHPLRPAGRLSRERWERLVSAVRRVLRAAIRAGGTTLNDFQNGLGDPGYFQVRLRVYGREGEGCSVCGSPVRRSVLSGRSTYYCGRCQR